MLGCGRHMADRTAFGLVSVSELDCSLHPCVQVMLVLLLQGFLHLVIGVPVESSDEVLVVLLACQSIDSLLFGLFCESFFQLPPRAVECDFTGQHQFGLRSDPPHELCWLPSPVLKVHDGGGNGTPDTVPWVLLGLELLVCGMPCLLKGW